MNSKSASGLLRERDAGELVGEGARTDLLDEVEDRVGEGRIGERERLGVGLGLHTLRHLVSL